MDESQSGRSDFTIKKKVDESWKDAIDKEKAFEDPAKEEASVDPAALAPNFSFFLSTIGMQALIALGEAPDQSGIQQPADLHHAHYLIEVLRMLSEKTKGNLSPEEDSMMKALLYELELKFVEKVRAQTTP